MVQVWSMQWKPLTKLFCLMLVVAVGLGHYVGIVNKLVPSRKGIT